MDRSRHTPVVVLVMATVIIAATVIGAPSGPIDVGAASPAPSPVAQNASPAPVTTFYPSLERLSMDPPPDDRRGASLVAYSPDGSTLAVGAPFGIGLYAVSGPGSINFARSIDTGAAVVSLAYSPDGSLLAAGFFTDTVQLREAAGGALVRSLVTPQGAVNGLAFDPQGTTLATASADGAVRLWRVSDGKLLRVMKGHVGAVLCVAFAPDGASIASGGTDGSVRLWQAGSGVVDSILKGNIGGVPALAFGPDGGTMALGAGDGALRLWGIRTGIAPEAFGRHRSEVSALRYSPDGWVLATGSYDGDVMLWQVANSRALTVLPAPAGAVSSLAFSPDGASLAVGALDGAVHIWEAAGLLAPPAATPIVIAVATVAPTPQRQAVPTVGAVPCTDQATFVADVTVPDGMVVAAGSGINKTWRVRNSGTCPWGPSYQLMRVAGDSLGSAGVQAVIATPPGANVDITVAMYAPAGPGAYRGVWQLANPSGRTFGPQLLVDIQVPAPAGPPPPSPTPTATRPIPAEPAEPAVRITASDTTIDAGQRVTVRASVQNVQAAWLDGEAIVNNRREVTMMLCEDRTFVVEALVADGRRLRDSVTVRVRGECAPIEVSEPDLVVSDFKASPMPAKINRPVVFQVVIKNRGTAGARGFDLMIMQEQMRIFAIVDGNITLAAGAQKTLTWTMTWPALAGALRFDAWVDSRKVVDEPDNNNNIKSIQVPGGP